VLNPGGFGENLCIEGLQEAQLCPGDVHRIGNARLQVCQPRQPCFKLALRFDDKLMPKAMTRTGRAGWYYRVLEAGVIATGDCVQLEDRPNPDFSFELIAQGKATRAELERLSDMKGLASGWQLRAQESLARLDAELADGAGTQAKSSSTHFTREWCLGKTRTAIDASARPHLIRRYRLGSYSPDRCSWRRRRRVDEELLRRSDGGHGLSGMPSTRRCRRPAGRCQSAAVVKSAIEAPRSTR
jgi:hypothetical protein